MKRLTIAGMAFLVSGVLRMVLAALGVDPVPAPEPETWVPTTREAASDPEGSRPSLAGRDAGPVPAAAKDAAQLGASSPVQSEAENLRLELARRELPEYMWRQLYEIHSNLGQLWRFRRKYDALPARPLGVLPSDYRSWMSSRRSSLPVLAEPASSVAHRLSKLNRKFRHALMERPFQLVAHDYGGRLAATVGGDTGGFGVNPENHAKFLAATHDQVFQELAPGEQEELVEIVQEWRDAYDEIRSGLWEVLDAEVTRRRETGAAESDVVAVLAIGSRLHVIRRGDEPELERILEELVEAERRVRSEVEDLYQ